MTARRWQLVGVWVVTAIVLGGALLAAQLGQNPLNDRDLAYQRPGILDIHGEPFPAPTVTDDIPSSGMRAVVFFTRPELLPQLKRALDKRPDLGDRTHMAIVVSGDVVPSQVENVPIVADPGGRLAGAFRLNRPRDGGPPVGYAVVDSRGRVRYHTLDPYVTKQLDEVETIVRATP